MKERKRTGSRSSGEYDTRRDSSQDHSETEKEYQGDAESLIRDLKMREDREMFRRTVGRVLVILGVVTILDSCAFFPIPLIGAPSIIIGAAISLVGFGVLASKSRMKLTNEALKVALKNNNRLTVARLALELDISLGKAEKIIRQFVKKGIAEIDLEAQDPSEGLVYRIRGI
jgi:hypothetical protein